MVHLPGLLGERVRPGIGTAADAIARRARDTVHRAGVTHHRAHDRRSLAQRNGNGQSVAVTVPARFPGPAAQRDLNRVADKHFSPTVKRWVEAYSRVGKRTPYLWKWCLHGLELTTLPCVLASLRADVCDTKLLGAMFGVLLDDVADRKGDGNFLEALLDIVSNRAALDFSRFSLRQRCYARVACELWNEYLSRARRYPRYSAYKDLLHFDHLQLVNAMRYSRLLNRQLSLLSLAEHDLYLPHNMQMMSFATLDLMCSPSFKSMELGKLRDVIWRAQYMGRIGNLMTTWQREIADRDYTSGVFARATSRGDLTLRQLAVGDRAQIEAAIHSGRHEAYFLRRWNYLRQRLWLMRRDLRSFDLGELVAGLERLLQIELGSRGLR